MRTIGIFVVAALVAMVSQTLTSAQPTRDADALEMALSKPILESGKPIADLRAYVADRIPKFEPPRSAGDWESQVRSIRRRLQDEVIFRGAAAKWRDEKPQVRWFDAVEGGSDYVIRKFRYEALRGMWIPGLLYEPKQLQGKAAVFINVNGHDPLGKATPETQLRCINLARRGMLAYLFEFLNFGQLENHGNRHNALVQLDLCGTSGVAPFVLALTRGLDVAMSHPHADTARVGMAGLSGGGWQTVILSAIDDRIRLANPVAGHASMFTRATNSRDVGDGEQIASDLCTVADYTHLTAMIAPRPLLLTFNAYDECCFRPEGSLPPLENAARPMYELFQVPDRLRTHVNYDPGTHNFERENREKLYQLLRDHFVEDKSQFDASDLSVPANEIKNGEELAVPMPAQNATLHSLAVELSRPLPIKEPSRSEDAARKRLSEIIHLEKYAAHPHAASEANVRDLTIRYWQVRLDDDWTIPAVEIIPKVSQRRTIILADRGRKTACDEVQRRVEAGERLLVVELLGFGEAGEGIASNELQMIAAVGRRPLGVQAAQLLAASAWYNQDRERISLVALGPRSSIIALVAGALDPAQFDLLELRDSWPGLKTFIDNNLELKDAPELGCFGLLAEFEIADLESLIGPERIRRIAKE